LVGSDQYLIKPFNKKNIVDAVILHTQKHKEITHDY
jgi:DNA-binding response OmpR family regulator